MAYIEIKNICKSYPVQGSTTEKLEVLRNLNLSIEKEEFVCIFGPNGSGKTTLLNLVAGLLPPDKGKITISGNPPGKVKSSFIFQNFEETLLPWRTCLDNIAFPLEVNEMSRKEARKKIVAYLDKTQAELPLNQFPYQLSGGQKQLLVIYRALIFQPKLFLLDEPFNALDYDMRTSMEEKLLSIWGDNRITTLFVSHEVDEAIYLSDRVIVLSCLPAEIIADIKVDLKRPRTLEVLKTEEYSELRNSILSAFREGYRR